MRPEFSYSVARPYPYRWFPYVVGIGGLLAVILISAFNLAATGYDLVVEYTGNPNATLATKRWTQTFPFDLLDKTKTTCQAQNIPVNSQFFTDKLGLTYTLSNVWQRRGDGVATLPSLKYTNNVLQDCTVRGVQIDLSSTQRNAAQQGWTTWGAKCTSEITCAIYNDETTSPSDGSAGPTFMNISVAYDFVPPSIDYDHTPIRFINAPDNQTQASLWWAESLL